MSPAPAPRPRAVALLLSFTVMVAACGGSSDAALPQASAESAPSSELERGGLVIVLPAVDQLDPEERIRVRLLVERAVGAALPSGISPELIEPATVATVGAVVEAAARRVDAVCVVGATGIAALLAVREFYPSLHGCVLPTAHGSIDVATTNSATVSPFAGPTTSGTTSGMEVAVERAPLDGIEVDLLDVGMTLGRRAREVAGEGIVVVLDGGDPLLDRRWALGVLEGAEVRADGAPAPVRVVRSADAVLQLIQSARGDEGATLSSSSSASASGTSLAGPASRPVNLATPMTPKMAPISGVRRDDRDVEDELRGPALLPVGAVVLDASPGTDALATLLLDAGIPVVVPRSLVGERPDDPAIIARWRIRWDIALVPLLRRAAASLGPGTTSPNGPGASEPIGDLLAIDEGPALVAARARLRSDDLG